MFAVFRRADTKKRINISGNRYAFNSETVGKIISILSPPHREHKNIEAEIDDDGDIRRLVIQGQVVAWQGKITTVPATTIEFEKPSIPSSPADTIAYRQCIEVALTRVRFISQLENLTMHADSGKLADPSILVSLWDYSEREMLESIVVHYRKIFEQIMFACWTAFEPRMTLSYDTWQVRTVHDHLKATFADVQTFMVPVYGNSFRPIPPEQHASFTAAELLSAYRECGDTLHTEIPYRKPFDVQAFLQKAAEWRRRLQVLLTLHRVQIGSNEFVFSRSMPNGKAVVWLDQETPTNIPSKARLSLQPK
jgi:hypothetical protein